MSKYDDFDLILSDFNKVEERFFLSDIRDFAEKFPEVVTRTYGILLKGKDLNIQLKYLVFKSMGELKYKEFIPMVKEALYKEDKPRLITEAVECLIGMSSLPAFKVVVDFLKTYQDLEHKDKLEKILRTLYSKNQLLYHYDIFYRDKGDVNGIDKSSNYLIENLPEELIKDLLPALSSRYYHIRYQLLRILKHRPNALYYSNIYHHFKENLASVDEDFFLVLSEALIMCACQSKSSSRIFENLKEYVSELKGVKKIIFCITLLKLNTRELQHFIASVYQNLNFDRKFLVLNNLNPEEKLYYLDFVRQLLTYESNEILLAKIVEILTQANEFPYMFETINSENGMRKAKILNMILDEMEKENKEIDNFVRVYVTPHQDNQILKLSLGYLLKYTADKDYELIKNIFFSGVSIEIKILIIRNVNKLDGSNQKFFIETVFKDISVIRPFRKDFLFTLLGVMNEKLFEQAMEEKILNRVLVMMEEAHFDEIVNFVYFFDRYQINNKNDSHLIIEELRMIQNTLLKSANDDNLVKMIHVLVRNIEKKMMLKK